MSSKNTILFDLDGTLLPIDMDDFLKQYFKLLTKEFSDLVEADKFIKIIMASTEKMVKNNGDYTNEKVFKKAFFDMLNINNPNKQSQIMKRFDYFYENEYPKLKDKLELKTDSPELIKLLHNNFKLVIATNPLFPKKAIIDRIKWAGLNPDDFDYITSYEHMHYSKPNPEYYSEITEKIGEETENCIMIGNDCQEDMIAKKVGMSVFLIEDYKISRKDKEDLTPDWKGTMEELIIAVKNEEILKD